MSRVLVQFIVQSVLVAGKAVVNAYGLALKNAKAGGTGAAAPGQGKFTPLKLRMSPDEALKILNIGK